MGDVIDLPISSVLVRQQYTDEDIASAERLIQIARDSVPTSWTVEALRWVVIAMVLTHAKAGTEDSLSGETVDLLLRAYVVADRLASPETMRRLAERVLTEVFGDDDPSHVEAVANILQEEIRRG